MVAVDVKERKNVLRGIRNPQLERKESMKRFGQVDPLLVYPYCRIAPNTPYWVQRSSQDLHPRGFQAPNMAGP